MESLCLENIYRDYHQKVCHFVLKKVGDSGISEDLVSDIFLKIAANLDRYDKEKSALSTWIYTISNNTILDYYRTRRIHSELPDENGENGSMPQILVDASPLDSGLLTAEALDELAAALETLPQRSRDLIILHYYGNLTLKEVARKLGMSYANVKLIHKKALAELKEKLS